MGGEGEISIFLVNDVRIKIFPRILYSRVTKLSPATEEMHNSAESAIELLPNGGFENINQLFVLQRNFWPRSKPNTSRISKTRESNDIEDVNDFGKSSSILSLSNLSEKKKSNQRSFFSPSIFWRLCAISIIITLSDKRRVYVTRTINNYVQ